MESFSNLIATWPGGASGFAHDIGIKVGTVRQMKARDRIPLEYFPAIVGCAQGHGLADVTLEDLVRLGAARKQGEAA